MSVYCPLGIVLNEIARNRPFTDVATPKRHLLGLRPGLLDDLGHSLLQRKESLRSVLAGDFYCGRQESDGARSDADG